MNNMDFDDVNSGERCELCGTPLMDTEINLDGEVTVIEHLVGGEECSELQNNTESVFDDSDDEEEWREQSIASL